MSIWLFFIGHFVELPYTLVQDYTLTSTLRENSPRIWDEVWQKLVGGAVTANRQRDPLLTDVQWKQIEPRLPALPRSKKVGRAWDPNRAVLEGVLWILRTGAR